MAIHAAMVDRMDREIGRVLDQLRAMGALDNTLIFFLSDNGASAEIMVRGDGHDPDGRRPARRRRTSASGPAGRRSATRRSAGTRRGSTKAASPRRCIVHWPKGIAARGELRADARPRHRPRADDPGARGRRASTTAAGPPPAPPGRSLVPAFAPRRRGRARRPLVAARGQPRHPRRRLEARARAGEGGPWELYDLGARPRRDERPRARRCRRRSASWSGSGRRGRGSSRSTRSTAARSAAPGPRTGSARTRTGRRRPGSSAAPARRPRRT